MNECFVQIKNQALSADVFGCNGGQEWLWNTILQLDESNPTIQ